MNRPATSLPGALSRATCLGLVGLVLSCVPAESQEATEPASAKSDPTVSAGPAVDPVSRAAARTTGLLQRYIAIDTTNPPGTEMAGATFLAELFEAEGIEARVLESAPGRGNVYARLEGSGEKRPILLLSHIDVVPTDPAHWSHPPYAGEIVAGELYGRGSLDCKGAGVVQALSLIALRDGQDRLARDVIFLATADEEAGGRFGAGWILDHHPELFEDVEYVLNEGGFIHRIEGKPLLYNLNAAEKGPCWFRLTATGEPGHGSRPARETAVTRLIEALHALLEAPRPHEVGPVVAGYFAAYAAVEQGRARQLRQLSSALEDEEFYEWFTSEPYRVAQIVDTVAPTVFHSSAKTNIVPAEVSVEIDSRLLPGHSCEDFLRGVGELVGSDHVRVESLGLSFPSTQSPLDNELTRAIERLAAEEDALVFPGLLTGFTDSHWFRERGIHAYGFVPVAITPEQRKTVHAPNERVSVAELEKGVHRLVRLLHLASG